MSRLCSMQDEAYIVFERRRKRGLRCAVPVSKTKPKFLTEDLWERGQTVSGKDNLPIGFCREAARHAVDLSGYYLFHSP